MSTSPDIDVLAPHRPGFADEADVDQFVETLARYERGEIDPDAWRAFRLLNGVYGQRQDGAQMVRVKLPLGVVTAPQLRALADVAEWWSNGKGHVTTRQNVQFHFVDPAHAEAVLRHVAAAGITTREACGNSVRNVTGSPFAGIHPVEPFDPTPYGEALVRHLLRGPWSAALPRKFKIAVGGSSGGDDVFAAINDVGLLARLGPGGGPACNGPLARPCQQAPSTGERAEPALSGGGEQSGPPPAADDGAPGFRFTIGGGLATFCRSGSVVEEFLPAGELLEAVEAVIRVFHRIGNRTDRNRARLRHAIHAHGLETVLAQYRAEREVIRAEGGRPYTLPAQPAAPVLPPAEPPEPAADGYADWALDSVKPQKQRGFAAVVIRLFRGDITAAQFRALADLVETLPEPEVRTTVEQNLLLRYVPTWRLTTVHRALAEAGLALAGAGTIVDVTSCPGAASCKLAVTASRGLAGLLSEFLAERPHVAARARDLQLKVSGCPNSCGQHHIAGIGFQGGAKKVGGRLVPLYHVFVGGGVDDAGASFGRLAAKVPARRVPQALERLLALFDGTKQPDEAPVAFFRRVDLGIVRELLADLTDIDAATATEDDLVDLGTEGAFAVEVGQGECAA